MTTATLALARSPSAHRVANRDMSWFEPIQAGHAPGGRWRSTSSTIDRMAPASSGALMNGKLKARWSSSSPLP